MAVKLFILGLPGSGKSTISRYIVEYAKKQRGSWATSRFNDYAILWEMFQADSHYEKFRPTDYNGFDVLDLSKCDTALKEMEERVRALIYALNMSALISIEFSRNDYTHAFAQFNQDFLQDGYFLFLDVEIDICKQRINDRVAHPKTEDDYHVSEYIFQSYYNEDSRETIFSALTKDYKLGEDSIILLNNNGSEQDFEPSINRFLDFIFEQEGGNIIATSP